MPPVVAILLEIIERENFNISLIKKLCCNDDVLPRFVIEWYKLYYLKRSSINDTLKLANLMIADLVNTVTYLLWFSWKMVFRKIFLS